MTQRGQDDTKIIFLCIYDMVEILECSACAGRYTVHGKTHFGKGMVNGFFIFGLEFVLEVNEDSFE